MHPDGPDRGDRPETPHASHGQPISKPEDTPEEFEDEPQVVLITGASGNIGRKLRAAWPERYELVLLDRTADPDDPEVIAVDLGELDDEWITHFHGVDTVVHLAADPDDAATWEALERPNLDAMANVFHASALAGVGRVIFASSNHVVGGYRDLGDMPITVDLPPLPDGPYGATKLMGERLGRSLARAFDLAFVALRLGCVQPGATAPTPSATTGCARSGYPTPTSSACSPPPSRPSSTIAPSSSSTASRTTAGRAGTSAPRPSGSAMSPRTTPMPRGSEGKDRLSRKGLRVSAWRCSDPMLDGRAYRGSG